MNLIKSNREADVYVPEQSLSKAIFWEIRIEDPLPERLPVP